MNNVLKDSLFVSQNRKFDEIQFVVRQFSAEYVGNSIIKDNIFAVIQNYARKKEIALERNRKRWEEFYLFYPKEKLISEIKINPDRMIEFTYFILEKEEFKTILENREKSKMTFYLIQQYRHFKSKQNEND